LIASTTVPNSSAAPVRHGQVRSPQLDTLRRVSPAGQAGTDHGSALLVRGAAIEVIGDLAARNAITLHELSAQQASLEEAYMKLTDEATEYRAVSQ
jgi:ABC-2 type transport system ATP-binding protein